MRRLAVASAALVLAAVLGTAPPAQAGQPVDDFVFTVELDPTAGPRGTTVEATGTCLLFGEPGSAVFVRLFLPVGAAGAPFEFGDSFPVAGDGSFSGQFAVPFDAPDGDYELSGACVEIDAVAPVEPTGSFRVEGGPFVTTTSTTSTTTQVDPDVDDRTDTRPRFTG
jgi:hypothetical protein